MCYARTSSFLFLLLFDVVAEVLLQQSGLRSLWLGCKLELRKRLRLLRQIDLVNDWLHLCRLVEHMLLLVAGIGNILGGEFRCAHLIHQDERLRIEQLLRLLQIAVHEERFIPLAAKRVHRLVQRLGLSQWLILLLLGYKS